MAHLDDSGRPVLSAGTGPSVSVVVSTFERPEACLAAVVSALEQDPPPLEVLVCDDGSRDATAERIAELVERDARVRYLRLARNHGTPGPARTIGVREACGEWVAFLDDDDRFLPGKLARQVERAARGDVDVIGTNAKRGDAATYFPAMAREHLPTRADLLCDNPLIVSSVMARRSSLLAAGGFRGERWARGVADYAMWLALADRDARFVVLPEPLVRYEDAGEDRMSVRRATQERAAARVVWSRWLRAPGRLDVLRAALSRSATAARLALGD